MAYIDWSDPEALFDMLVEYTADEKTSAHADARRERFLAQLLAQLETAQEKFATADLPTVIDRLREIIDGISPDFQDDPVVDHFTACLEELERLHGKAQ